MEPEEEDQSYIDPDTITSDDTDSPDDIRRVSEFRQALAKWKQHTLIPKDGDESDKIEVAHLLMEELNEMINAEDYVHTNDITPALAAILGPREEWSLSLILSIQSAITTDLFEYTLTFNTMLVDTFKEKNYPLY